MKVLLRTAGLLAVVTVGVTAAAAAPAYAADGLADAKRVVTAQLDGRLAALKTMSTAVDGARRLAPAHKTALSALIGADTTALTALRDQVAGETTVQAVRADATSMVNDYRVYLLVGPMVRLTVGLDVADAAVGTLRQMHDRLAAAVAAAKQAGRNVGDDEAKLADLSAQLDGVQAATAGKADALLALKPGTDAAAITNAVKPIREAVHTARADLRKAMADAKDVRKTLR